MANSEYNAIKKYIDYFKSKRINNNGLFLKEVMNMFNKTRTVMQLSENNNNITLYTTIYPKILGENLSESENSFMAEREENFYISFHLNQDTGVQETNIFRFRKKEGRMSIDSDCYVKPFDLHDLYFFKFMYKLTKEENIKEYIEVLRKKSLQKLE